MAVFGRFFAVSGQKTAARIVRSDDGKAAPRMSEKAFRRRSWFRQRQDAANSTAFSKMIRPSPHSGSLPSSFCFCQSGALNGERKASG